MDQPKARGPYAKTAARRADILRAARESFSERGFEKSTLRDIATRAGITHVGLLHHFANKDAVLVALMAQRDEEESESSRAEPDSTTAARFVGDLIRDHQKTPELMRLWTELAASGSRPDHPAHTYLVDRYARARSTVAAGRSSFAGEGLTPEAVAALLVAVLDGLQIQWLLDPTLDILGPLEEFLRLVDQA